MFPALTTVKMALIGGAVGFALVGVVYVRHEIMVADQATLALAQNRVVMVEQHAEHERIVAALQRDASKQAALATRQAAVIDRIRRAPTTKACALSPAVAAALDGLRHPDAGAGPASPHPGEPKGVPAGTDPGGYRN